MHHIEPKVVRAGELFIVQYGTIKEGEHEYETREYLAISDGELKEVDSAAVIVPAFIPESMVGEIIRRLSGKVLTTIDAVITDPRQNKAVKDIMKDHVYNAYEDLSSLVDPNDTKCKMVNEMCEDIPLSEIGGATEEEVDEAIYGVEQK